MVDERPPVLPGKRSPPRFAVLTAFLRARFASGHLGLHLTIGAALLLVTAFIFGSIADGVVNATAITLLDMKLAAWFHAQASPFYTTCMLFISTMNSIAGVLVLASLFGVRLFREKSWHWLLALVVTVPGGMLLNFFLKLAFQRARPSVENSLLVLTTYSFPSGHTSGATLFYGLLAAYVVSTATQWRWRALVCLLAITMIALVGLSRMYLGVHYFSDVLGAVAAASAWLTLTLTAVAPWRGRPFYHFGERQ